jgi:hypothetical protein
VIDRSEPVGTLFERIDQLSWLTTTVTEGAIVKAERRQPLLGKPLGE